MALVEKGNTIIVGFMLIVIAAVAMIGLIPMAITASESPKCPLVGLDKLPKPGSAKSVASSDGKALVIFDAYLQYSRLDDEDNEFVVPLNLTAIEVIEDEENRPRHRQLVLNMDCAQFKINFEDITFSNEALIMATGISAQMKAEHRGLRSCTISGMAAKATIRYSPDKHYSRYAYSFVCKANEQKDSDAASVEIQIDHLAIELDGDVKQHRTGKFSKPADNEH